MDRSGLRPIDHAAGRSARGFLEPETEAQKETMKILRDLVFAKTGREPEEFKGQPAPQRPRGGSVPAASAASGNSPPAN